MSSTHEAERLIAKELERLKPDRTGYKSAATQLLIELRQLRVPPFVIEQEQRDVRIFFGIPGRDETSGVFLTINEETGHIEILKKGGWDVLATVTGLWFNRVTKQLEADAFDETVTPTPGRPKPRRSPLAVVVEQAIAAFKKAKS